jgi:hypothetical protein
MCVCYMIIFQWPSNLTRAYATSLLRFVDHAQLHTHTHTHMVRHPERGIGSSLRRLPTQQTQETNIRALIRIGTRHRSS